MLDAKPQLPTLNSNPNLSIDSFSTHHAPTTGFTIF